MQTRQMPITKTEASMTTVLLLQELSGDSGKYGSCWLVPISYSLGEWCCRVRRRPVFPVTAARLPCWQAICGVMHNIPVTPESFSYHEPRDSCRLFLMKSHHLLRDLRNESACPLRRCFGQVLRAACCRFYRQ
jgi:hypothetical protein